MEDGLNITPTLDELFADQPDRTAQEEVLPDIDQEAAALRKEVIERARRRIERIGRRGIQWTSFSK